MGVFSICHDTVFHLTVILSLKEPKRGCACLFSNQYQKVITWGKSPEGEPLEPNLTYHDEQNSVPILCSHVIL